MRPDEYKEHIEEIAASLNHTAHINSAIPWICVEDDRGETTYFSQGDDAKDLLTEAETAANRFNVTEEDYILFTLESAGVIPAEPQPNEDPNDE